MSTPIVEELLPAPDPIESCARFRGMPYLLFLDSARDPARLGRYSFLCADPALVVHGKGPRAFVLDTRSGSDTLLDTNALGGVRELLAPHLTEPVSGLPPFQGGAAGYLAYDWGAVLERLPSPRYDDLSIPDVVFAIYDWVIAWDHLERRAWIISTGLPDIGVEKSQRCENRLTLVRNRLSSRALSTEISSTPAVPSSPRAEHAPSYPVSDTDIPAGVDLRSSFTHRGYLDALTRVREYIVAGDIFQANLSQRFEAPLTELAVRAVPAPAHDQSRALRRLSGVRRCHGRQRLARALSPARHGSAGRGASDQGHAPARRLSRPRCRAGPRAPGKPQGSRGKPDDRGPDAKRPVARVAPRECSRAGAVRARALRHSPSPRLYRHRRPRARARCDRSSLRHLPRRFDHRRSQGARHGDHCRARAVAPRRVLRLHRLSQSHGRHGHEHRHSHLSGNPRASYTFPQAVASSPTPTPSRNTARPSTRLARSFELWQVDRLATSTHQQTRTA